MPLASPSARPQLIYLVFGAQTYHQEAQFSISSALANLHKTPGEHLDIQVFSDDPHPYRHLPVTVHALDADTRKAWSEPHGYHFRTKHVLLRQVLQDHEHALLIDTDTFFHQSPIELFRRMQPGTLLRLFYLDGSGAVSAPQGEHDTADHQDFVGCDIRLTYQGPTPAGDRDPMRIGGNVVRWSESTVMDSLGGVEYEYDTICKAGDLRRVFYREQIPGVGADQQIGRFTGIDKPREQTTHVNGCDVSRSTDYQLVFSFNPGDPSPRGMNGQKLCN